MADPIVNTDPVNARLRQLADQLGLNSNLVNRALAGLREGVTQTMTETAEAGSMISTAFNAAANTVGKYAVPLALLTLRTTAVSSAVYGSDKAFTSLTPVLDSVGAGFDKLMAAAKSLDIKLNAHVAAVGFATFAFSKISGVLKTQLENAQKVADAFVNLSQMGVNFGFSINEMALRTAQAEVPLQTFVKIVQANAEKLSQLGDSMEDSGLKVASMARDIFMNAPATISTQRNFNLALAASYGNMENLSAGIANYLQLQAQAGANLRDDAVMERIRKGEVQEYLMAQKQLTALTGKNNETLKKEEEERRKVLAYTQALNKMSPEQRANTEAMMSVAKMVSPELEKMMMTSVAFGDVVGQQAGTFYAMNTPLAETFLKIQKMSDQDPDLFMKNFAGTLKAENANLQKYYQDNSGLAQLGMITQNDMIKSFSETGSGVLRMNGFIENMSGNVTDFQTALSQAAAAARKPELMDRATAVFVEASQMLIRNQLELDTIATKNMANMTGLVSGLNEIQTRMIRLNARMSSTVMTLMEASAGRTPDPKQMIEAMLATAVADMGDMVTGSVLPFSDPVRTREQLDAQIADLDRQKREYRERLLALQRGNPAPTNTPAPAATEGQNPSQKAEGGITNGPTVAGERGQEAVIPLSGGNIPMRIDWSPLVAELREQTSVIRELVSLDEDMLRTNRSLLDAVS